MSGGDNATLTEIGSVALNGFKVWDRTVQASAKGEVVTFVSLRVSGVVGFNPLAPAGR